MAVTWENPPPKGQRPSTEGWDELVTALKGQPGRWAVFAEDTHSSYVGHIKNGKLRAFQPAGSFEARYKETGRTKRGKVWVRYVGEHGEFT